jgi:hypothetical protein
METETESYVVHMHMLVHMLKLSALEPCACRTSVQCVHAMGRIMNHKQMHSPHTLAYAYAVCIHLHTAHTPCIHHANMALLVRIVFSNALDHKSSTNTRVAYTCIQRISIPLSCLKLAHLSSV